MRFKLERGRWGLRTYPWHSVNLIPCAEITPGTWDAEERKPSCACLWVTILGQVTVFTWPSKRDTGRALLDVGGPAWSRRGRRWYTITP
jgi:hypothetical protein